MNDPDREFWMQVRRGLMLVVTAIDRRWNFPRATSTFTTLGHAPPEESQAARQSEPPPYRRPLNPH